jgi:hypothetical protein
LKIHFEQSNALLFLLPAVVLVASAIWFTYRSRVERSFYTPTQRRVLALMRSFALGLIAILISAPAIQLYQTYKRKPLILIASDNSQSLANYRDTSEELITKAKEALNSFKIEQWTFGQTAQKNSKFSSDEVRSDYSELFHTVQNTYLPSSVSAMLIFGDGIFNSGTDPVYTSHMLNYPVYTIGLGDTTQQLDAVILKVRHNQSAFWDNYFPVAIDWSCKNLAKKRSEINIWEGDELVAQRQIDIGNNDFFHQEQFRLQAKKKGIVNYRVEISRFDGERNTENNQYDFSIRVIDQKQKILILSNGPNPDNAALTRLISSQKNYAYELVSGNSGKINPTDYDLVILNQLPDKTSANSRLIADIQKLKKPSLWITGLKTDYLRLNNLLPGFQFNGFGNFEYATAAVNKNFDFFQLSDFRTDQIETWPPLQSPFTEIELNGNWETLIYQRVQQINLTRPLICLGHNHETKTALIAGEGIWKWRMHDFVQNGSNEVFDNLFLKLINYLILKPNEDNFNIYYQQNYTEDQELTMTAELFDENYEPLNIPEVKLKVSAQNGPIYDYTFDKTRQNYYLNIGKLPAGSYSLEATVNYGGKQLIENGSFRVDKIQLEQRDLQANFNTLYQIAKTTGGQFAPASDLDQVLQKLKADKHLKTQKFKQLIFREFFRLKWLALLIILFLCVEWFLRKYWGSY